MAIEILPLAPDSPLAAQLRTERALTVPPKGDNYFRDRLRGTRAVALQMGGATVGYAALEERVEATAGVFEFFLRRGSQRVARRAWEALAAYAKPGYLVVRIDDPQATLLASDLGLGFKAQAYCMEREAHVRLPGHRGWELLPLTHERFEEAFAILAPESPWEGGHSEAEREPMRASIGTHRYHTLLVEGKVAGVGMLVPIPEDPTLVDIGMVIARPYRRQGLASWMLSNLASEMEARGHILVAGLGAHNVGSRRSLEKAGFRVAFAWSSVRLGG